MQIQLRQNSNFHKRFTHEHHATHKDYWDTRETQESSTKKNVQSDTLTIIQSNKLSWEIQLVSTILCINFWDKQQIKTTNYVGA